MQRFELRRLDSYDEESLLAEMRRVAALIKSPVISQVEFNRLSKASSSVIQKRFGTWENALAKAGLAERYSGSISSKRVLAERQRSFTDDELIAELQAIAAEIDGSPLTVERFNQHSSRTNAETIRRRFGSWWKALERAGLQISNLGKRYSEADYFENLLNVWTHYGRQPSYGEMDRPPSKIQAGTYYARWGTWRKALRAFIERVNADLKDVPSTLSVADLPAQLHRTALRPRRPGRSRGESRAAPPEPRTIRLGLRYEVLRRDNFRCVLCGASPATQLGCELHIDHLVPVVRGGRTEAKNLRVLCSQCNVGKGAKSE